MKNSIVVKFLAIILCALFLLSSVASGLGILAFTTADLYEKSVDQVYDEAIRSLAEAYAYQVAFQYASTVLGECPDEIVSSRSHYFTRGYYGYTLMDKNGTVLTSRSVPEHTGDVRHLTVPVGKGVYQKLVSTAPAVESYPIESIEAGETPVINQIPYSGVPVRSVEIVFQDRDLAQGYAGYNQPLGELYTQSDGTVSFCSYDTYPFLSESGTVSAIVFYGMDGQQLYKAVEPEMGVGSVYVGAGGYVYFDSYPEEMLNVTMPPTIVEQDGISVHNHIPGQNVGVFGIEIAYLGSGEVSGRSADHPLGYLSTEDDGTVVFTVLESTHFLSVPGTVSYIAFYSENGELFYEASSDYAVGQVLQNEEGQFFYRSWLMPKVNVPATEEPSAPPTEPVIQPPTEAPVPEIPQKVTDNLERLGIQVATVTIFDEHNYTSGIERATPFGYLYPNPDGTVTFQSYEPMEIPEHAKPINRIAFLNAEGNLLYEVQASDGVGEFSLDSTGRLMFVTTVTAANIASTETKNTDTAVEEATEVPTETEEASMEAAAKTAADAPQETVIPGNANIIADVTEPVIETAGVQINTAQYWDDETQTHIIAEYVYEDMPEGYTLELWLLPGAYELDPIYDLLQYIWQLRHELFYVLGVSVLLFAIFAVYLCCAAGRKPGREEVRPGGINCLPLDIYVGLGGLAIYCLAFLCVEGGYYLLRNSPHMLAPLVLIAGYIAALIIVSFSFACAAQFKTPGGYWWRNTFCAGCIRLVVRFGRWLEKFLGTKFFPFLGRCIKFSWRGGKKLCIGLYRYTDRFLKWFVRFSVRWIKRLWKYLSIFAVVAFRWLEKTLIWLGKGIGKIAQRTHAWLHAFLSLLPVTWQWLLVGLALLLILAISLATRSEGIFMLAVIAGMALVVYGSHCFGILWDSTKNMTKGNLDAKVDDKLMIGAFKDYAADLNALADVAVIAAQKQLKSERMKTELITNVSHDIKTPLTSIINYVDLLQKPHTDEEQEVYLEVLARQSQQMKKLLEDLIDMSKASTGNMQVYPTRLNVSETISQAIGEFSDKLDAAQLIPVIRQPEEELYIQADGRLVWRVLSNILSNVVKYALPGTRVYIDVEQDQDNVLISVKNISREELNIHADELMERFVRGDTSRNTEGSGLGLNIARSLMEIQKGKLDLLVDGDLFKVILTLPGATE